MRKDKLNSEFYFLSFASNGLGLSGGDRIYIEFARHWSKKHSVKIYTWDEGFQMCQRLNLRENKNLKFVVSNLGIFCKLGYLICYLSRIIMSIKFAITLKLNTSDSQFKNKYIYSSSEFLMDSIPALIVKLRFPDVIWIATWYQTAPKPWANRGSIFYWLTQIVIKPFITNFANFVLVNNNKEKQQFEKLNEKGKVIVVLGAVDLSLIQNYKTKSNPAKPVYDAVFQGRFHAQKGVLELIDIWKLVVSKKPNAKLAMIGDGPLMAKVKFKIYDLGLENNVKLFGYLFDGPKKYGIFSKSKLVVHPAFYDSGGMASAEAMAFGLPCVGFNLPAYKSYYPQGMLKVKKGNINSFADAIISLLENRQKWKKYANEATSLVKENWSWDHRSQEILSRLIVNL